MSTSAVIPYIDSHCHTHGFPYDAWETVGATGIAAAVISAGNPHVHREIHEEVPDLAARPALLGRADPPVDEADERHIRRAQQDAVSDSGRGCPKTNRKVAPTDHSITSSARARMAGAIVSPSSRATRWSTTS